MAAMRRFPQTSRATLSEETAAENDLEMDFSNFITTDGTRFFKLRNAVKHQLELRELARSMGHRDADQQNRFENVTDEFEKTTTITTTTNTTQNNQQAIAAGSSSNGVSVQDRYDAANEFIRTLQSTGKRMTQHEAKAMADDLRSGQSDDLVRSIMQNLRSGKTSMLSVPAVAQSPPLRAQPQIEFYPQPVSVPPPPPQREVYSPPIVQQPVYSPLQQPQPVHSPSQQQQQQAPPAVAPQHGGHQYQHTTTMTTTTSSSSVFGHQGHGGQQILSPGAPQYATSPVQPQLQLDQQLAQLQITAAEDPNDIANSNQQYAQLPMQQQQQFAPQGYAQFPTVQQQQQTDYASQGYTHSPQQQQQTDYASQGYTQSPQQQQVDYVSHSYAQSPQQQQQQQYDYLNTEPGPSSTKESERAHRREKKEKKERAPRKYRKDK